MKEDNIPMNLEYDPTTNSSEMTFSLKMTNEEDITLMAQQDMVYEIIKMFLKSSLAVKAEIVGIDVQIQEGYVNAAWKFGKREPNDVIE